MSVAWEKAKLDDTKELQIGCYWSADYIIKIRDRKAPSKPKPIKAESSESKRELLSKGLVVIHEDDGKYDIYSLRATFLIFYSIRLE